MTELDEMMGFLITTGQVDDTFALVGHEEEKDDDDDEDDNLIN